MLRLRGVLADLERRLPGSDVDQEVVSGFRRGAARPVLIERVLFSGPNLCVPAAGIGTRGA